MWRKPENFKDTVQSYRQNMQQEYVLCTYYF